MKISEQALASELVAWLEAQHWDVYQEVRVSEYSGSPIADVVAVQGRLVWIVECKTTLGLAVLGQALRWRGQVHFASVCAPQMPRRGNASWAAERFARELGVGLLTAEHGYVSQHEAPRLNRRPCGVEQIRAALRPEHKTYAKAGSARGGYWTPFRQTCHYLREAVEKQPGVTLRDAIANIQTHYSSPQTARSSLPSLIEKGVVRGVRLEREGRALRLYPDAAALGEVE
jgi:hypothetical protein